MKRARTILVGVRSLAAWSWTAAVLAPLWMIACGEDSNPAASGGASGTAGSPPGTGGQAPLPAGTLKAGWQKAFKETSAGISCSQSSPEMDAAGAVKLTFEAATIYVGFEQDGQNQNPVFARFDGGVKTYCEHHEKQAPDGRAYGITWDGGPVAYVVYTMVGGGSAFDSAAKGSWQDRYGDGGGSSKVSFLGRVETQAGTLQGGTFVIARTQAGKTNTARPADALILLEDGSLEYHGDSAFQPMNPDKTLMQCSDYPFFTKYVFSGDFSQLLCSSSTNCTSNTPCP
jgi:hypothetical protein